MTLAVIFAPFVKRHWLARKASKQGS